MTSVLKPMAVAITGTSLSTGRLSADWVPTLLREARTFPEAKGPLFIYNMGHGGWTSLDILAAAPRITGLKPTHILTEGGAINDCVDFGSGPAVSPATHIADIQNFVGQWLAGIPGVDITLQTMSSVSSYQTARTALAAYYANELTTAAGLGIRTLNNYPGWPNPLSPQLTNGTVPRAFPLATGFSGWAGTGLLDLNPATCNSHLALSGNNQIAIATDPMQSIGFSALGQSSGKNEFEAKVIDGASGLGSIGIGLVTAAASLNDGEYVGSDSHGYGYRNSGLIYHSGGVVGSFSTYTTNDVVDVALDSSASKVWFAKNGVWQNGDPVAGTGGLAVTPGTYFPAVNLSNTSSVNLSPIGGDGLHPIWTGAVDTYLYPNVKAWLRARMAAFWP